MDGMGRMGVYDLVGASGRVFQGARFALVSPSPSDPSLPSLVTSALRLVSPIAPSCADIAIVRVPTSGSIGATLGFDSRGEENDGGQRRTRLLYIPAPGTALSLSSPSPELRTPSEIASGAASADSDSDSSAVSDARAKPLGSPARRGAVTYLDAMGPERGRPNPLGCVGAIVHDSTAVSGV